MSASGIQLSVPHRSDAIDWAHLDRATLGDTKVAAEVLALFAKQAGEVAEAIRDLPPAAGRLAHGIKGAARGIGAHRLAEAAQAFEQALASAAPAAPPLAELLKELEDARIAATSRRDVG